MIMSSKKKTITKILATRKTITKTATTTTTTTIIIYNHGCIYVYRL